MNKQLEHKKVVCGDILENILIIDESSGGPTVDYFKWMYSKDICYCFNYNFIKHDLEP